MLYIVYIYIIYIYYIYISIYIYVYMCIYWPVKGSNLRKSHFRAVFFLFFWSPDPPLTHLIKAIWVFFVPLELCDILVINKKFGVIY